MEEKTITKPIKYIRKIIVLGDQTAEKEFKIQDQLRLQGFSSSYKQIIGLDVFVSGYLNYNVKAIIKFQFQDISTAPKFEKSIKSKMFGAKGCIIIFDYNLPDILLKLEKWIFDTIIVCGNIPIFLLGINHPTNVDDSNVSDVKALVYDKTKSWELAIHNIEIKNNHLNREELLKAIYSEIYNQILNPNIIELRDRTLENLKIIILNEKDVSNISEILGRISRAVKISSKKLLHSISSSFFKDLIQSQEILSGIPEILDTFQNIDLSYARKFIKNIDNENLISKIERETLLSKIEHLFFECSIIDLKIYAKLIQQIPSGLIISKISDAWINVTIVASWSQATIAELLRRIEEDEYKSGEIVNYISEVQNAKKKKKTFNRIGKLLAILLKADINLVIKLIEDVPIKVQELALLKLNEIRDESIESTDALKIPLEVGELYKKEAAKKEILHGLGEVDLLLTCLKHSKHNETMELLAGISYDILSLKIKDEKDLSLILELLNEFYEIDEKVINAILDLILDSFTDKISNEPSILIIQKLLELVKKTKPNELKELIHNVSIEALVNKLILYFGEMDLNKLNIPFLVNHVAHYGRERYYAIWNMLRDRFPNIPDDKLEGFPKLIFTLLEMTKPDLNVSAIEQENQILKIFDFFIKNKLDELDLFIEFILENYKITKADIKEVFLSQLTTEDVDQFSYEKNKLYDYVLNLYREEKA